jgi:hypothetical protein
MVVFPMRFMISKYTVCFERFKHHWPAKVAGTWEFWLCKLFRAGKMAAKMLKAMRWL